MSSGEQVEVDWTFVTNRQWRGSRHWTTEDFATVKALIPEGYRIVVRESVAAQQQTGALVVVDADNNHYCWVGAGYVGWANGFKPEGLPVVWEERYGWWRLSLSRRQARDAGTRQAEKPVEVCSTCFCNPCYC